MEIEEFDPATAYGASGYSQAPLTSTKIPKVSLSPQEAFVRTAKIFAPAGIGLIMIVFGLTNTGSYYTSASRFGGVLADIFYGWQAGTLIAMIGTILIYDAVKRTGYL